ncbi:MAG: TolC family protein [Bryobacterales bacterium]|nr:TolC family protein [Bryobacterales bacterium]
MRRGGPVACAFYAGVTFAAAVWAQTPAVISLAQAQQIALRNHPRIASAAFSAEAGRAVVNQVRAAYYPALSANVTAVGSQHNATLSSGFVTTSSLYSRGATGITANQLLTDFGRTSSLEQTARLRNASQNQNVINIRAQVLLEVKQAYYAAIGAEAVLKVAQATLNLRRVTQRQVSALAKSALRSSVDERFAEVNVSQAELDLLRAENDAKASHARLSASMGYDRDQPFSLLDEPLPPPLNPEADALIADALKGRPDLLALQLNRDALGRFAEAEKRLRNPTVSAAVVAGVAPVRDQRIQETYSAAGVNLNIPVLNGGLFKARREEAESRAAAASKDVQDLSVAIARDVRVAWLEATDAFRRLDVTARMVAEANEALRLARARYNSALGSIVELNQAEVNQTSAEIASASAKYDYLIRRAALDYTMGALR